MCGICGYSTTGAGTDEAVVYQMTRTLEARGPDDAGHLVEDGIALGHRRLSIVDLRHGRQPLANEDETVWVVANGEIYNFPELRRSLEARGHRFRTRSDTEVVVHLYEDHGDRFVEQLSGMFALALWDVRRKRLVLARDRMGQKPLYYAPYAEGIAFASELKALREHPELEFRIDPESVSRYLLCQYVPAPHSIYHNVFKLDRSECLAFEDGRVRTWQYWQPAEFDPRAPVPSFDEAADNLWEQLRESVRRHLLSDVPLGVFLSGGIDSSSLVACMREILGAGEINTFTMGFGERSYDESEHARTVARHFGATHYEQTFDAGDMLAALDDVADYLDEPFADPSVLPTYLLCRFAREKVKVALGGDGGDELLGGYPTFLATQSLRLFGRLPRLLRAGLGLLVRRLPVSHRNMSVDFLLREYLRGAGSEAALANQIWMGAFAPAEQRHLLHPVAQAELDGFDLAREMREYYASCVGADPMARLLDFYSRTYLQEGILAKIDRASMAHGLEVRAPFLDPDLMNVICRLPISYRIRGTKTKRVLKRAALDRMPASIVHRTKRGFGIPAAAWLAGPLRDRLGELLSQDYLKRQGLFSPEYVSRLVDEHQRRRANYRKPLWTLLMFQLWYERHGRKPALDQKAVAPPATVRVAIRSPATSSAGGVSTAQCDG